MPAPMRVPPRIKLAPEVLAWLMTWSMIAPASTAGGSLILGGTLMGAGIGVMHYTGMAAMRMDAVMRYDPVLFVVSVVVAVVLAITALYTKFAAARRDDSAHRRWWIKLGAAL